MRIRDRFDLTYCSNIHAGETWPEVAGALRASLPEIRRQLRAEGPFAIGLRVSAQAAAELEAPRTLAEFRAFLRDGDYYVPTVNGFPYGAFHGQRVKELVYLPDWRQPARVEYSNRLASLLTALLEGASAQEGSISTVPGAFKGHIHSPDDARAIAAGILAHAAHLVRLRDASGITIALAIEPEPACFVETIAEAVDFFTRYLFDESLVASLARQGGYALSVGDVKRHVGVCFDACHMAVEFEDAGAALSSLASAGIRVPKFQISSALRVPNPVEGSRGRAALARFSEDTYLHQVVERASGQLSRFVDLPDALASPDPRTEREWRIHFHVPVFLAVMGDLETTQPYLESVLDLVKQIPDSTCLEVETYTWDVLPPEYRTVDMNTAIARELAWTRARLGA
jgi:sugar phosphate isomerase/epimerase